MAKPSDLDLLMAQVAGMQSQLSALEQGAFPAPSEDEPRVVQDLLEGGSGLLLNSKVQFGYLLHPGGDLDAVRIYTGTVNGVVIAQPADVSLAAGTNVVYARVAKAAGGAGSILSAASLPAEDVTYYYYWLYTFTVTAGTAALTKAARPFNIEAGRQLPSNANKTTGQVLKISANVGAADDPTKWTIAAITELPAPPESGTYFLMAIDGVVQWVEGAEFACPP